MIQFEVRGLPVPQGSAKAFPNPKTGGSIVVTQTPKLVAWRRAIADEARKVAPERLIEDAVSIQCSFFFDRPKSRKKEMYMKTRPDLDKLVRAVLDGCTNVIWKDDSQVWQLSAEKLYGLPGVHIIIDAIAPYQKPFLRVDSLAQIPNFPVKHFLPPLLAGFHSEEYRENQLQKEIQYQTSEERIYG